MVYFEITNIKNDLRITDTTLDTELTDWGAKADEKFNDVINIYAQKNRRILALPVLPLTGTDITETVKNASNWYVKSAYYLYVKNPEMSREAREEGDRLALQFVEVLKQDSVLYGRVAR